MRRDRLRHSLLDRSVRRTVPLSLALVFVVMLAGCSGGASTTTKTTTRTTTEATIQPSTTTQPTTAKPTLADVSLPPGVTNDSVTTELVDAYRQSVRGNSVTVTRTVERSSGATRTSTARIDGQTALRTTESTRRRQTTWYNASGQYTKTENADGVSYSTIDKGINRRFLLRQSYLAKYFETGNFEPTGVVESNGTTLIRLQATEAVAPKTLSEYYGWDRLTAFDGTALVTPDGLIETIVVNETFVRRGKTHHQTVRVEITNVGDTAVSRPNWVQKAVANAITMTAHFANDTHAVVLNMSNGKPIEAGTSVFVHVGSDDYRTRLDAAFAPGDQRYLYVQNGTLHVTTTPPSGDTRSLRSGVSILVYTNGRKLYQTYLHQ